MLFETGHALKEEVAVKHCSYDNTDCYEARTIPVIYDLSQRESYLTGGQNLTVYGHGFNFGKIDAKVDGADCIVTSKSVKAFSCQV
jgi:hypothetical protein